MDEAVMNVTQLKQMDAVLPKLILSKAFLAAEKWVGD
jgi:hypothetical protein